MRSILIRTIVLLIQFVLCATAVHLLSIVIDRLFEAYLHRYRRLPMVEFLLCLELQPPQAPE